MKYTPEDLKLIYHYEEKRGIRYAKAGGKLYNRLLFFGLLSWIWLMLTSVFYILGRYLQISSGIDKSDDVFVSVLTVFSVMLLSIIAYALKQRIIAFAVNIAGAVITCITFIGISKVGDSISYAASTITEYDRGYFGLKKMFFWRHGIPAIFVAVTFAWLIIITIKERSVIKKEYELISKNNYKLQFELIKADNTDEKDERYEVKTIKCPNCGANIRSDQKKCEFCDSYLTKAKK